MKMKGKILFRNSAKTSTRLSEPFNPAFVLWQSPPIKYSQHQRCPGIPQQLRSRKHSSFAHPLGWFLCSVWGVFSAGRCVRQELCSALFSPLFCFGCQNNTQVMFPRDSSTLPPLLCLSFCLADVHCCPSPLLLFQPALPTANFNEQTT